MSSILPKNEQKKEKADLRTRRSNVFGFFRSFFGRIEGTIICFNEIFQPLASVASPSLRSSLFFTPTYLINKQDEINEASLITTFSSCSFDKLNNSCGHVVRDFESEAKTRCNF